ncbi:MAG TPA: metallophosphoesterase [Syntrophobacteraceae bacterium]|nr:metallophosphoesterase [Syntrophobacteraceae bacterium]HBD08432.1 metallophosphoesterase [Syntrophobacteraceae bacterium]HBZ57059.1 metallophosphoesterase [Syntrophobacteraceae bacterium]
MSMFLVFFLLTYGGMHALVYHHARRLWVGHPLISCLVATFMVAMVLAPIGVRLLENWGFSTLGQGLAYLGYVWMGFLFLSFCGFVVVSAGDGSAKLLSLVLGQSVGPLARSATTLLVLALAAAASGYGAWEAWDIRVERVRMETTKLPTEIPLLTIAQISDVHLGLLVRSARLGRILAAVRAANPDILVSTGDLVDGQLDHLDELATDLQQIRPRYGKFAVTGNHEFFAGLGNALDFTKKAGFTVLRDQMAGSDLPIAVVGVDYRVRGDRGGNETELLKSSKGDRFVLVLKHVPAVSKEDLGRFDLQLSGHTHRGQIFPFRLVTGMVFPMQAGFYPLERGSYLYTSRGSGTWGPPMRLGSPPEVTIIELVRPPRDGSKS